MTSAPLGMHLTAVISSVTPVQHTTVTTVDLMGNALIAVPQSILGK